MPRLCRSRQCPEPQGCWWRCAAGLPGWRWCPTVTGVPAIAEAAAFNASVGSEPEATEPVKSRVNCTAAACTARWLARSIADWALTSATAASTVMTVTVAISSIRVKPRRRRAARSGVRKVRMTGDRARREGRCHRLTAVERMLLLEQVVGTPHLVGEARPVSTGARPEGDPALGGAGAGYSKRSATPYTGKVCRAAAVVRVSAKTGANSYATRVDRQRACQSTAQ